MNSVSVTELSPHGKSSAPKERQPQIPLTAIPAPMLSDMIKDGIAAVIATSAIAALAYLYWSV